MKDSHLTLRLPGDLARALSTWAHERRIPKSQVARDAVAAYLSPAPSPGRDGRLLTAGDLAARWKSLAHLNAEAAGALGADIAEGRAALPGVPVPWE